MSTAGNPIETMGKLFADGSAIDQLRDHQLVLLRDGRAQLGPIIEHDGETYIGAAVSPHLERLLPASIEAFSGLDDLLANLRKKLMAAGLDEKATLLVAMAVIATWVSDCLPGPLVINLWGATGTEMALLDLMVCVCRRGIRLAEPTSRDLAKLAGKLVPTVILSQPGERTFARLFAAVGDPNVFFLSAGEISLAHCPMVVFTSKPVTMPALTIPLFPTTKPLPRLTYSEAHKLSDFFQPRLLSYRLTHHLMVKNSQFDVPDFCPKVRLLARVLGAAAEGSPGVQSSIIDGLRILDEQQKAKQCQTPPALLVEILLGLSHNQTPAAYVRQITDMANAILENREENTQLSPRAVGEILRQQLGLAGRRRSLGYELALDLDNQRRVHRLAHAYGTLERLAHCPRCEEIALPSENEPILGW